MSTKDTKKEHKHFFINEEVLKKLNDAQSKILKSTDFKPSIKRLVNEIANNQEAIDLTVKNLIEKLGS